MPESPKNTLPLVVPRTSGKRPAKARHGVYSWLRSKRGTTDRASKATIREVGKLMGEFEAEHTVGGKISPGARALIMGTCEAEGVVMLIGTYLRKYGVLDNRAAKRGTLELTPLLSKSWLAYQNTIRQNVLALEQLKASRGHNPEGPDLNAIRAEYEVGPATDAPGCPVEARVGGDEGQGQGKSGGEPIRDNAQDAPEGQTEADEGQGEDDNS